MKKTDDKLDYKAANFRIKINTNATSKKYNLIYNTHMLCYGS